MVDYLLRECLMSCWVICAGCNTQRAAWGQTGVSTKKQMIVSLGGLVCCWSILLLIEDPSGVQVGLQHCLPSNPKLRTSSIALIFSFQVKFFQKEKSC